MTRARWQMHRDLLEADRMVDDGDFMEAYDAYLALTPRIDREDLLGYVRFRLGYALELADQHERALDAYAEVYRHPQGLYDHTAGQAMYRTALMLRDVWGDDEAAIGALQAVVATFPNTYFADDALLELIDTWRERGQVDRLYGYLTANYGALRYSEIADNFVYWTGRVLQDDLGRPADAIEVYRIILYNFHPSGLLDDATWRTALCYRSLGRLDAEYWLLKAFVDAREVSWVMADYESEYYRPSLERMAEIHLERGEVADAIAVYERFQRMYPLSLLRDDTQYRIMELQAQIGDVGGMRRSLAMLQDEYPGSRFTRRGAELLTTTESGGGAR